MQTALFTYRRRVQLDNGEEVYNDNFINPQNVNSMFWQINEETGRRQLNVFLVNQFTVTFAEETGTRFVQHMEEYLQATLQAPRTHHPARSAEKPRRARMPVQEIVEDESPSTPSAEWASA
jgi:hypothetical protein